MNVHVHLGVYIITLFFIYISGKSPHLGTADRARSCLKLFMPPAKGIDLKINMVGLCVAMTLTVDYMVYYV